MKRSNASFDIPDFDLPVDPEFIGLPPQVSLKDYCRLNREFRNMFPQNIPTEEERLERKVAEVFVL